METHERANQETDKPMEESRRNILKTAKQYLARDMNAKEVLIKMPHVFTRGEEEKITSRSTQRDKCIMFLDILQTRGDEAYDVFKKALAEISPHLIPILDQAELQTVLDDERKKKEEIEKDRDELSRKLQEKEAELNNLLENLEKKVKAKGNEIEEWKKKLSEVQKKWDQLKEKSDCHSGQIEQLQKDRDKWQTRSKTFEDEIRKSRIFVSSIFLPFDDHAPTVDVIHHLRENKLAKIIATRSSDGSGEAIDVIHNRKGPALATEEKPNSWWQIDLGENHLLFITHYALTDQKRAREGPRLTSLQLEGSSDGREWGNLTQIHVKDLTGCSHLTSAWRIKGKRPGYRYFRIVQTSKTVHGIRLCGIWLYGVLVEIKALGECLKLQC